MKHVGVWILLVGLFGGTQCSHAEEIQESALATTNTANLVAAELWGMMRDAGMIDGEQYQFVLENGHLPVTTTVKDSPIPEEEQSGMMNLERHAVITPKELASILYQGNMPDMTDEEYQAFVDLAPVYEADRSKRLGYQLRRKHQKVELIRLAHRMKKKEETRYATAVKRAEALGLPMHIECSDGSTADLVYFNELDHPVYYRTMSLDGAYTISTDE